MSKTLFTCLLSGSLLASITSGVIAKTTINIWVVWGGDRTSAWTKIAQEFERLHPGIQIKFSSVDQGEAQAKLLAAVASGSAPDLQAVNDGEVPEFVERRILTPLSKFMKTSGLKNQDFFASAMKPLVYKGETWALPLVYNSCFSLAWNKTMLERVGIDARVAPVTIEDLELINTKVTKTDSKGAYTSIGMFPPSITYAYSNAMMNWGWIFGGDFFDENAGRYTVDHPGNLRALQWWVDLCKRYSFSKLTAGGAFDIGAFYKGKLALATGLPNLLVGTTALKAAGVKLEYGVTGKQPYPTKGGVPGVGWGGGWTLVMPKGTKHPKETWEFMKWFLTSDYATLGSYRNVGIFPGYAKSAAFKEMTQKEPGWAHAWLENSQGATFGRPPSPGTNTLMKELDGRIPDALTLKTEPASLLAQVNKVVNAELNKWQKRAERK